VIKSKKDNENTISECLIERQLVNCEICRTQLKNRHLPFLYLEIDSLGFSYHSKSYKLVLPANISLFDMEYVLVYANIFGDSHFTSRFWYQKNWIEYDDLSELRAEILDSQNGLEFDKEVSYVIYMKKNDFESRYEVDMTSSQSSHDWINSSESEVHSDFSSGNHTF
jgi:hypothetical protein